MRNRLSFVAWLFVASLTGCVYHQQYPYGYNNGYYGNGFYGAPQPQYGYPTAPGNYYTPGTPSAPTFQPGGGAPTPINGGTPSGDPNSQPGTNWNSSPPSTYDPNGGNNAPTFDPNTPGSSGGGSKVPFPNDDSTPDRSTSNSPLTPTTSQSTRSRASKYDEQTASFGLENRTQQPQAFDNGGAEEAENAFEEPRVRQVSGNEEDDFPTTAQRVVRTVESSDKPYGHDVQFRWVKGVVEYDEQSGLWVIMYDDNPPTADTLGGELYLAKHKSFGKLQPGDQILIEGALDNAQTDPKRGLPLYQITRWKKQ